MRPGAETTGALCVHVHTPGQSAPVCTSAPACLLTARSSLHTRVHTRVPSGPSPPCGCGHARALETTSVVFLGHTGTLRMCVVHPPQGHVFMYTCGTNQGERGAQLPTHLLIHGTGTKRRDGRMWLPGGRSDGAPAAEAGADLQHPSPIPWGHLCPPLPPLQATCKSSRSTRTG